MSQPWKLLPLAAIVAVIGALLLAPGGARQPSTASAYECGDTGSINVYIFDFSTDEVIEEEGSVVRFTPDTATGNNDDVVLDNGGEDIEDDTGILRQNGVCITEGDEEYEIELVSLPNVLDDCDIEIASDAVTVNEGQTAEAELYIDCTGVLATPTTTATVTATPGAAATVTTSASPGTITCSGTSIVTIQVRDEDGDPVPAGTTVTISTTIGSVSPSTGQTTDASGNAFVFLTAPASSGGTATVKAESGDAEGSTTVTINCGATPAPTGTTAPPPTVVTGGGGVISPPNTGNAGLAADGAGTSWIAFAGIGLLAAAAFGAVGIVKVRA